MAFFAQQNFVSFVVFGRSPNLFHLTVVEFCSNQENKNSLERSVANPAPALTNAVLARAAIENNTVTMAVLLRAKHLVVFSQTSKTDLQLAVPAMASKIILYNDFFMDPFKLAWFAQFKMGAGAMRLMVLDHIDEAQEAHDASRVLNVSDGTGSSQSLGNP